jgi:gliding motility-associated-like protein
MMGGKQKLQIDRHTGRLTVWPDMVGQYVVGVRVTEYRNGRRIGESLRDYQFNVLECKIGVQAGFNFPELRCSDTVVTFTNTSSASNRYMWSFDSLNSGVSSSNTRHPTKVFAKKGVYKIKLVAHDEDCSDSVTHTIHIGKQDSIQASFTAGPTELCAGDKVQIVNTSDPTPDWFWDLGKGLGEQHNIIVNEVTYDEPGIHVIKLRIIDSLNCMSEKIHTDTIEIFKTRNLLSEFDVEKPSICNPGKIILTKTDSLSEEWIWQIEGINKEYPNESVVELDGLEQGSYTIRLISLANSDICTKIKAATEVVNIEPIQQISKTDLYNVFTPNQDGSNECYWLDLEGHECTDVHLVIYNRWGELIFDSEKDQRECWDGNRPNGKPYPEGTYFGLFTLQNTEAKYYDTISVTISLIR